MPVRRFIGYFIALSACSTIAFASSLAAHIPAQEDLAENISLPPLPHAPVHLQGHKSTLRRVQVALAE